MKRNILISCVICLLFLLLTSCTTKESPASLTDSFLNALKINDIEKASTYVSFDGEVGIGGDKQAFLRTYSFNEMGFVLHKYKVLKVSFFDDLTKRVYVIVNVEWNGEKPENQIYACDVMKVDGNWKVVLFAQVEGDVPLEINDIYPTPDDVKRAVY